jgi:hypothetical protein
MGSNPVVPVFSRSHARQGGFGISNRPHPQTKSVCPKQHVRAGFSKLKHGLGKAAARSNEAVLAAIGKLIGSYTHKECAN